MDSTNQLSILDTIELFLNNRKEYSKKVIECTEGRIYYFYIENEDIMYIYSFELYEKYQRKGILTKFIQKIISNNHINQLYFAETNLPMTCILLTRSFSDRYFAMVSNGEICWSRYDHDRYNHVISTEICNKLLPGFKKYKNKEITEDEFFHWLRITSLDNNTCLYNCL